MRLIAAAALLSVGSGVALGQEPIVTFGFTDLNGSFDAGEAGTGRFLATSAFSPLLNTGGDVTRGEDTADFDAGTFGLPGGGSFVLDLSIFGISPVSATGVGTFEIVDADGDRISGDVSGTWFFTSFGLAFFNADVTNVTFENVAQNGPFFTGSTGGAFGIADLGGLFEGGLSVLFLRSGGFQSEFEGVSVQADGLLIPAPATTALLAAAGVGAARRRRA